MFMKLSQSAKKASEEALIFNIFTFVIASAYIIRL
jgi:hypothetical protein